MHEQATPSEAPLVVKKGEDWKYLHRDVYKSLGMQWPPQERLSDAAAASPGLRALVQREHRPR